MNDNDKKQERKRGTKTSKRRWLKVRKKSKIGGEEDGGFIYSS